jgi:hypothetical protein
MMPALDTLEIFAPTCGEIAGLARGNHFGVLWGGPSDSHEPFDAIGPYGCAAHALAGAA